MFSKVIECLEQNIRKYLNRLQKTVKYQTNEQSIKYLKLKYGNTKLLGNTKYNQVKLVLQFLCLLFCTKLALNYIKQARHT